MCIFPLFLVNSVWVFLLSHIELAGQVLLSASVCKLSFIGNTATSIRFHIVCGCFHPIMTQLGSFNRDPMACKAQKYLLSGFYRKSLLTPDLEESGFWA